MLPVITTPVDLHDNGHGFLTLPSTFETFLFGRITNDVSLSIKKFVFCQKPQKKIVSLFIALHYKNSPKKLFKMSL